MASAYDFTESDSEESSPPTPESAVAEGCVSQKLRSPLLRLPVDIFKCITDYLDRDTAWALKRVCRGLSTSKVVDELLYRYPFQVEDVRDLRLADWKYRSMGLHRWINFQNSINDANRNYVQKLAMSHWCSIADFRWIEEKLPSLTSLDLTAIRDFVWTPEETWTWKELIQACPKLFARIEELEVANWADYTAHSRIEYSYSYNDYRFKQRFRQSRRRDGGSIAKMVFPACTRLKTLAIRERYSGFHAWNEWEVHQRVCCLVDGITKYCPPTLSTLRVHDYAPYRSLFAIDAPRWQNLSLEIALYSWMEDRADRDPLGPIPFRITPGSHHREEEEAFDDKTFESCKRDHIQVGSHVVQGWHASFEDLLHNLRSVKDKHPTVNVKPIKVHQDMVLHPFHFVHVTHRRGHAHHTPPVSSIDPISSPDIQTALRWLAQQCNWRPLLAWDTMMCDVFPANLEPNRQFLPKAEVMSRIRSMVQTLKSLNIPIRLSIGDRANTCPNSGLDGSLYFGDYKCFIGEGDQKRELLAPTQARFNLSWIAEFVDELTIQYPVDVPGVVGLVRNSKEPTEGEIELLNREKRGWQRFWARYACQFNNLKKLTATIPTDIYEEWGKSEDLRKLFEDDRWNILEIDDKCIPDLSFFIGGYLPYSSIRYNWQPHRKRPRMKFVQKVFFRLDQERLRLDAATMTEEQKEELEITDEMIAPKDSLPVHRFWLPKVPKASWKAASNAEKRKLEEDGNERQTAKKARVE
ncbi:hypothetical protein CC78DRAFT_537713 [Lojkania enalia]|uniref:F-box domain-containing protein n=1 Tax=Lojkania enalia TaxID=147567 RepID=A0A9P4K2W6_9PLEO|nr:hypothetical protein CC78DRAFT_537713 [Didymosphaeria enalia]